MPVLVDSGVVIGFLHRRDQHHSAAVRLLNPILAGEAGAPVITDYLVDEALTYLVARGATRAQLEKAIRFMLGDGHSSGAFTLLPVGPDHFAEALRLVRRHRERRLSFTDCTCLSLMEGSGIGAIASFDGGFDGLTNRLGGEA